MLVSIHATNQSQDEWQFKRTICAAEAQATYERVFVVRTQSAMTTPRHQLKLIAT